MSFYDAINRASDYVRRVQYDLNRYNDYASPRSEPNSSIRNNSRSELGYVLRDLEDGMRDGRWDRVSYDNLNDADRAARLISHACVVLADRPDRAPYGHQGRPANVPGARDDLNQALYWLNQARW